MEASPPILNCLRKQNNIAHVSTIFLISSSLTLLVGRKSCYKIVNSSKLLIIIVILLCQDTQNVNIFHIRKYLSIVLFAKTHAEALSIYKSVGCIALLLCSFSLHHETI